MASDFEIGRVVAVDTAQVTIELNSELKALTRSTYEGPIEVGRINSYVIMPVGARRLVAMITRVVLVEEAELKSDRTMVTLPAARRLMKATLIGTIDGKEFTQGVSLFPVLDNPVCLVTRQDLGIIFDQHRCAEGRTPDPDKPGYCLPVGESPIFMDLPILINPDAFFGKHAAVLGSTGSGKSCTIASILQAILEQPEVRQTTIIILDTNGEYRSAFQQEQPDGQWQSVGKSDCLYIPSDPQQRGDSLVIPFWFMNSDDFVRIFRAREGLQSPVLLRALRLSRADSTDYSNIPAIVETLRTACSQIIAIMQNDSPKQQWALAKNIVERCIDGLSYKQAFPNHVKCLENKAPGIFQAWERCLSVVKVIAEPTVGNNGVGFGATRIQQISDTLEPFINQLNQITADYSEDTINVSADQPRFFDRTKFIENGLETAMREQAESGNLGRIRDACGPMFLRIRRYIEDPRFNFLFSRFPNAEQILAAFLRDLLGLASAANPEWPLTNAQRLQAGVFPFYDRQRAEAPRHNIVILDMSLLAAEVLENVTALIGRLVLEFLQRLGEYGGPKARGSLPVVMVLEEAQNYIREQRFGEDESIARAVFERIAREGRKFGLGLVVSSQRPSELSKTVLSQCSSFIVHRLQNPEDLRYFKEIVPGTFGPMLDQLPALAPQTAMILGECVRAPALIRIREARPKPRSHDPKFYKYWTLKEPASIPVEEICAKWEGANGDGDSPTHHSSGNNGYEADQEPATVLMDGDIDDLPF